MDDGVGLAVVQVREAARGIERNLHRAAHGEDLRRGGVGKGWGARLGLLQEEEAEESARVKEEAAGCEEGREAQGRVRTGRGRP